jgi:hypothetical protein
MDVQRNAKKFKLQEDHQHRHQPEKQIKPPPLPADPCPLLRPFCHQVSRWNIKRDAALFLAHEYLIEFLFDDDHFKGRRTYPIPAAGSIHRVQAPDSS